MKDEYSYTPKELLSQAWSNFTLALQVQQALWGAVISLDAITISALAIISNIYTTVNIWLIIVPIIFPFVSVILLILNFRAVFNVSARTHDRMLNAEIDEDDHIKEDGQYTTEYENVKKTRKKILLNETIAISFSCIPIVAIIVIAILRR
jgi:hypothetical protein